MFFGASRVWGRPAEMFFGASQDWGRSAEMFFGASRVWGRPAEMFFGASRVWGRPAERFFGASRDWGRSAERFFGASRVCFPDNFPAISTTLALAGGRMVVAGGRRVFKGSSGLTFDTAAILAGSGAFVCRVALLNFSPLAFRSGVRRTQGGSGGGIAGLAGVGVSVGSSHLTMSWTQT